MGDVFGRGRRILHERTPSVRSAVQRPSRHAEGLQGSFRERAAMKVVGLDFRGRADARYAIPIRNVRWDAERKVVRLHIHSTRAGGVSEQMPVRFTWLQTKFNRNFTSHNASTRLFLQ